MWRLQATLAFRYLWGRKLRTFLTTLAIVFGTLVIFSTNLLLPTMMEAFQTNMLAASGQVDVTITHKTGEAFSRSKLNRIRALPGIRIITGSLSRVVNIPQDYYNAQVNALTLNGIDPHDAELLRNYPIKEGRFLRSGDGRAAVISASLAETLALKLGDDLYIPTTEGGVKLKIVGLMQARTLPGNEEVLVTLSEAQKLLDLPDRINTIEINLVSTNDAERDLVIKAIESALGSDYTLGAMANGSEMLASIQTGQMAFNLFGFLALFMGGFIIFNTFRTIVAERRHDIGMLRALGASRATIIGSFLVEGLLQGVAGTVAGIVFGYALGALAMVFMDSMMSQFLHINIGAPVVTVQVVVMTVLLGVGVTLAAGVLPALNASRVTPLEALRPTMVDAQQRTSRRGAVIGAVLIAIAVLALFIQNVSLTALGGLIFLGGLVLMAPALVRPLTARFSKMITRAYAREGTGTLAGSNLVRHPNRAAITASATMIGLAIIVGLGGMVWSMSDGFLGILQRSLGSDYLVMPPSVGIWGSNVGAKQELGNKLRGVPGVGVVSSLRFASATINSKTVSLLGIDPAAYSQVASLTFQQGDSQTAFQEMAGGRVLIANGVLASQLQLKVGDFVQLATPRGMQSYRVAAVAGDYLNAKILTAYISQDNLQKDFRKSEDILYQLNINHGADPAQVEVRLARVLEDYPQFKLVSGRKYFEDNKEIFNSIYVFYGVLLALMSAPSLIAMLNTLSIGVIERTREIGMLRAVGASQKQVRRMVLAESLLLAAIGTTFGLAAGLYLGYVMVLGMSSGGFPMAYVFPIQGLLAAIVTGLLFGVLAALLPARQAAGIEIVDALHYE